jgi:cytochrome c-type biogenesis protein CcmH/NrfG
MLFIFSLQAFMLLAALAIVAVPFVYSHESILSGNYFFIALLTVSLAALLYTFSCDRQGLSAWLAGGKEHYQLLEQFNALGGIDGAITSIHQKLGDNPEDSKGWVILGKLYLAKNNVIAAHDAFAKAHNLAPQDGDITSFFERTH